MGITREWCLAAEGKKGSKNDLTKEQKRPEKPSIKAAFLSLQNQP